MPTIPRRERRTLVIGFALAWALAMTGCLVVESPPPRTAGVRPADPGTTPGDPTTPPPDGPKDPGFGPTTPDTPPPPAATSLVVEVYTEARSIRAGAAVNMEVRVRNVSAGYVSVHRIDPAFLAVDLVDDLGRSWACWNTTAAPSVDWDSFISLPPGGTLAEKVGLVTVCPSAKKLDAGIYRLRVRYDVPSYYDGSSFGISAWTGSLLSSEVTLEVEGKARVVKTVPVPAHLGLELALERPKHVAGDPVGLKVALVNRGKGNVIVGPIDPARLDVFITDPLGGKHKCGKFMPISKTPPAHEFATLAPGDSIAAILRVGSACKVTTPGTYFVRVRYNPSDDGRRHGFSAWTGAVISSSLTFFVAPAVEPPNVVASIYLDRGTYSVGDRMTLSIVVENRGGSETWIPTHPGFFYYRVNDAWGGLVTCKGRGKLPAKLARAHFKRLGPGDKHVHAVDLGKACSLSAAGKYGVRAGYVVPHKFGGRLFGFASWFTGEAAAAEAGFVLTSPAPTAPPIKLDLMASTLKKVYPLGTPLDVTVAVRNVGVSFAPMHRMHPAFIQFEVTGPLGTIRCGVAGSLPPMRRDGFYSIPVGNLVEERVDLTAACGGRLKDIGRYKVRALYQVPATYDGKSLGFVAWTGKLVSAPFEIEIYDPTPAPPKVVATFYGPKGATVAVGAPIPVSFLLKNAGARVIEVRPWSAGDLQIEVVSPGAKRFRCVPPATGKLRKGVLLFPGKSISWSGDLREACGASSLSLAGRYEVLTSFAGTPARPVAFTLRGAPPVVIVKPPPPPTRATLTLAVNPRGTYMVGNPMEVEVVLANAGTSPVNVVGLQPGLMSFDVFDARGRPARCTAGGGRADSRKVLSLPRGGTDRLVVDITKWCAIDAPGRYRVSGRASFKGVVGGPAVFTGVLVATPIWLDVGSARPVAPPPPPPPVKLPKAKLSLEAKASSASISTGDPLTLTVMLRNIGASPAWMHGMLAEKVAITGTVRPGVPGAGTTLACGTIKVGRPAPDIIRVGDAREHVFDLTTLCPAITRHAGNYQFRVSATFAAAPTGPRPGEASVITGTLKAAPVNVRVEARPAAPPPPPVRPPATARPVDPPRPPGTRPPVGPAPRPKAGAGSLRLEARSTGSHPKGGPVEISLTLRNVSTTDIVTAALDVGYLTFDVKHGGRPVACRPAAVPATPGADVLPRGNVRVAVIDLARHCSITGIGAHRVVVTAKLPVPPAGAGGPRVAEFSGTLRAAPVNVDVAAPDMGPAPTRPPATARPAPGRPPATARPAPGRPPVSARPVPRPVDPAPRPAPPEAVRKTVVSATPRPARIRAGAPFVFNVTVTPGKTAKHPMPLRFTLSLTPAARGKMIRCTSTWGTKGPAKTYEAGKPFVAVPKFVCAGVGAGKYSASVSYGADASAASTVVVE